ncbi:LicD family protein [Butyrivibrio sp. FCS006]|uniref:LicD family protein n=1 Tax=Butyrivibrio sp. FCS006 TaxID=1280684 RepID=UPI000409FBA8|nr:LicD family protein [Butyrivibrio sp. FCS006]
MKHSIDFFRDEIRYGFYVPTQVKIAWATALDVLKVIDDICVRHGITYFADWGTILGAVRHGGFVPWDDDLDICMLRGDYDRFLAVADDELPDGYCIHNYERQEDHWLFLARVVNRRRISFDEDVLRDNYNFPWLTGVDIFIKDYLYPDPAEEKKRDNEVLRLIAVADGITDNSLSPSTIETELSSIQKKYNIALPSSRDKRAVSVALYALAEKQMGRVKRDEAKEIGQIFPFILRGGKGEAKELYESFVRIPFEDTTIPVPAKYNRVLSSRYGNYNEIRKVWSGHTYPAFEAQKDLFEKSSNVTLPHFAYDPEMMERPQPDTSGSLKAIAGECLDGLKSLYADACALFSNVSLDEFTSRLGELQQLAMDLGTLIENVKGENNPHTVAIVSVLETFCEDIYNCSQSAFELLSCNEASVFSHEASAQRKSESTTSEGSICSQDSSVLLSLDSTLAALESALFEHLFNRKEILFLPIGPKEWNTLSGVYDRISNDPDIDPVVVPLPLFTRDYYGQPTMSMDEIRKSANIGNYPKGLPIQNWETYDLALHCPDSIYIQFPYDGENPYLTIPRNFFADSLRSYTPQLVYIPIGKTSEFGEKDITDLIVLRYYVTAPALIYADRIAVQSENIKTRYVTALTAFADTDTEHIWEEKIYSAPEIFDECSDIFSENANWKNTITEKNTTEMAARQITTTEIPTKEITTAGITTTGITTSKISASTTASIKKNLLYCISLYEFTEHADHLLGSIEERLDVLSSASSKINASLCFYPDSFVCSDPLLHDRIVSLKESIIISAKERGIETIPLPSDDVYSFVSSFDAYYGSSSPLVHIFTGQHKPVMIADNGI